MNKANIPIDLPFKPASKQAVGHEKGDNGRKQRAREDGLAKEPLVFGTVTLKALMGIKGARQLSKADHR